MGKCEKKTRRSPTDRKCVYRQVPLRKEDIENLRIGQADIAHVPAKPLGKPDSSGHCAHVRTPFTVHWHCSRLCDPRSF